MGNYISYIIFIIFNTIFGLSGLSLIGGAIYLMIKIGFNSLSFVMIVIGLIIFLIFVLGLKVDKKPILIMYLIFVMVIFLFYAGLSLMLKVFTQTLIDYIKNKVTDFNDDDIDKIKKYNTNLFIITCIGAACALFAFIAGILYKNRKKNKNKKEDINIDEVKEHDILHGIDYTDADINNREN